MNVNQGEGSHEVSQKVSLLHRLVLVPANLVGGIGKPSLTIQSDAAIVRNISPLKLHLRRDDLRNDKCLLAVCCILLSSAWLSSF